MSPKGTTPASKLKSRRMSSGSDSTTEFLDLLSQVGIIVETSAACGWARCLPPTVNRSLSTAQCLTLTVYNPLTLCRSVHNLQERHGFRRDSQVANLLQLGFDFHFWDFDMVRAKCTCVPSAGSVRVEV